jgi:hypothetical protein
MTEIFSDFEDDTLQPLIAFRLQRFQTGYGTIKIF